ncbi:hypothetical protein IAU59_001804 [Kwoniella sp. CBS 9459]
MLSSSSLDSSFESLALGAEAQATTPRKASTASPALRRSSSISQPSYYRGTSQTMVASTSSKIYVPASSSALASTSSSTSAPARKIHSHWPAEGSRIGKEMGMNNEYEYDNDDENVQRLSSAAPEKKSQSAKRRERKKKLIAGEKERAENALSSSSSSSSASSMLKESANASVLRALSSNSNIPSSSRLPPIDDEPHTPIPKRTATSSTSYQHFNDMYTTPRVSSSLATSKPITRSYENDTRTIDAENRKEMTEDAGGEIERRRRKTRRGGKRARQRRANGREIAGDADEIDRDLSSYRSMTADRGEESDNDTTSPTSSARTSRSGTPVRVTVHLRRDDGVETDEESDGDEDGDEVDELSALDSVIGTPQSARSMGDTSIMSVEDAVSSIDSFLSDPRNFMTIKANKLRLWQSLCIELGLVHLAGDELPDLPTVVCVPTPPRPRDTTHSSTINDDYDEDTDLTGEDRYQPESEPGMDAEAEAEAETKPYRPYLPKKSPLPQTLTQARKLLKENAHVNLVDYLEARKYCPPAYVGAYQGLLYPSMSAMKKYTRTGGKFALKDMVRAEWLEPLMKDFGIKKGKA